MTVITHRRYVPYGDSHYANGLVDGAYSLRLFGEVVTDLSIQLDGDEGLLAAYHDVQFRAPIQCGDVLEIRGAIVEKGTRSRKVQLTCSIVARTSDEEIASRSRVLDTPLVATEALATVVVPA